jgi:hypothetical protein
VKKFTPPTLADLTEYAATIGYADFDGQAFLDYYEACGWVVGKARKPMVSWQAAVRTWRRMAAQWSGKPVRKDSPEILAYAEIAREKIAAGGYEIGRFWRKVRDTIGVEGMERVQELAKQK